MTSTGEWVRAGHISFEQAEAIAGRPERSSIVGPRLAEVLAYAGTVGVFVATILLTVDVAGDDLLLDLFVGSLDNIPAGLVALLGSIVLLVMGTRLADSSEGAISRSGGFTLFGGWALSVVAFQFLLYDLDVSDLTPLIVLIPSALIALYVWRVKPSTPTHIAVFLVAVQFITSLLVLFQIQDQITVSSILGAVALDSAPDIQQWLTQLIGVAFGAAWIWLGATGRARPRNAAFFLGALYAWVNVMQLYASDDGWIVLSAAIALAFAWGATQWRASVLAAFSAVATVVLIAQIVDLVADAPSITTVALSYGIPGLVGLIAAIAMAGDGGGAPAAAAPSAMPSPEGDMAPGGE
jgi:hypothetical protein